VRLWSIHPKYLDARGLVALWRESLLAQAVLLERTEGYKHHPQLERFRAARNPKQAIATYLRVIHDEASERGYAFDSTKIVRHVRSIEFINVTRGQLQYEWEHLRLKLIQRDPEWLTDLGERPRIIPHPAFIVVPGRVESWEKIH